MDNDWLLVAAGICFFIACALPFIEMPFQKFFFELIRDKYCKACGQKLEKEIEDVKYDRRTGKEILYLYVVRCKTSYCDNKRKVIWLWTERPKEEPNEESDTEERKPD